MSYGMRDIMHHDNLSFADIRGFRFGCESK